MALVKCNASFSYQTAGGPRTIAVGELLDESDPAVVARRGFFTPTASQQLVTAAELDPTAAASLAADPAFTATYARKLTAYYLDTMAWFLGPWVTGQGSTSTTLTAQANAGATTLAVASGTSFVNGTIIILSAGTAAQQQVRVSSGGGTTTLTVTPALASTVANGATISPLWTNSSHPTADGYSALAYWIFGSKKSDGTDIFANSGKVCWLGDSWPANGSTQIAAQFASKLPSATFVNAGVGGNTSTQMIARFASDVPTDSTYVIINEPGVNDIYGGMASTTMLDNLDTLIRSIVTLGAIPVVIGPPPLADYAGRAKVKAALVAGQMTGSPEGYVPGSLQRGIASAPSANTSVGANAMIAVTTGIGNTALGVNALLSATTGPNNTAVGHAALSSATTGQQGTAVGSYAGQNITTGQYNTAVGSGALYTAGGTVNNWTTTASYQTGVGTETGQSGTTQADGITTIGFRALAGAANATAIGRGARSDHAGSVAMGYQATTDAADQVMLGARHVALSEVTDPGVAAANGARLYVRDNGAGKSQLCVVFQSGAVVVLATEA